MRLTICCLFLVVASCKGTKKSETPQLSQPFEELSAELTRTLPHLPAQPKLVVAFNGTEIQKSPYFAMGLSMGGKELGLPERCLALVKSIRRANLGLKTLNPPLGVLLLDGPTIDSVAGATECLQRLPIGPFAAERKAQTMDIVALSGGPSVATGTWVEKSLSSWKPSELQSFGPGMKDVAPIKKLLGFAGEENMIAVAATSLPPEASLIVGEAESFYLGLTYKDSLKIRGGFSFADNAAAAKQVNKSTKDFSELKHSPLGPYLKSVKIGQNANFAIIEADLSTQDLLGLWNVAKQDPTLGAILARVGL